VSDRPTVDELMADPTRFDVWRLRTLLERHATYAESSRAREILDNFNDFAPRIVKIMPVEYRRALEQRVALGVAGS
jgi:glutamate synthase (NADPH/NADH) large chain